MAHSGTLMCFFCCLASGEVAKRQLRVSFEVLDCNARRRLDASHRGHGTRLVKRQPLHHVRSSSASSAQATADCSMPISSDVTVHEQNPAPVGIRGLARYSLYPFRMLSIHSTVQPCLLVSVGSPISRLVEESPDKGARHSK